jgi:hypothetical protein
MPEAFREMQGSWRDPPCDNFCLQQFLLASFLLAGLIVAWPERRNEILQAQLAVRRGLAQKGFPAEGKTLHESKN